MTINMIDWLIFVYLHYKENHTYNIFKMKRFKISFLAAALTLSIFAQQPVDYVNPFIGNANFGTTNPGAVCPAGMMSVVPFNVMGSDENKYDKDARWWSTPYTTENCFFTGYAHTSLSGVGCPEMASLLLMPTTGDINVKYREYGSKYKDEHAEPGYYTNYLTKYGIKTEVSATPRTGIARFTFPAGKANILLNLGEGLTNETGASVRFVSDTEIEGTKLFGTFCYTRQAVFPVYFVMRINKAPNNSGYWKMQRPMTGVEAEWDPDNGKYKLYTQYRKDISGDDIGVYFCYNASEGEQIEVQMGISYVSIENARMNLDKEQPSFDFEKVRKNARDAWNDALSLVKVNGGTDDQKTIFYTAMYHLQIHPNILQDVNGEYPAMESDKTGITFNNRYTVFSLWDTYRNVHILNTLIFPDRQVDMINSMLGMYKEWGWLPRWELYGRETFTMEGDPALPVIADSWLRGLRGFDIDLAYEAMYKSATTPGKDNPIRPDNDDYMSLGYVPLREQYDNSVSHALEYYIADWNLAQLAKSLGKNEDYKMFLKRSMGYKNYYSKEYKAMRPITPDGKFLEPFNPKQGENFEPVPGFHEGSAWNYTFAVPHDPKGLAKLMGGNRQFVENLQRIFDDNHFDMANEPDIIYPYLFSHFKGEEWRTQKIVRELLDKYFRNDPAGLPGNDDTGTMSTWALFSMMGFYPDCPGDPQYTFTSPVFDRVEIKLNERHWNNDKVVLETVRPEGGNSIYIDHIEVDGKKLNGFTISHQDFVKARNIRFVMKK